MATVLATFYTVTDARYYPATVALLNSIRLTGHSEEVIIGDSGLSAAQRDALLGLGRVFTLPSKIATVPALLKAFPHLLRPDGIVIIIDSDMIVTGPLDKTIMLAREGKICAFADPERGRYFPEWEELFALSKAPRRQPYVTTSYLVFSTVYWPGLLARWWRACEAIPPNRTMWRRAPNSDPFAQGDQDAFNALLASEIPDQAVHLLADEERPIAKGSEVKVVDPHTLSCTYNGQGVTLLHADGSHKPWISGSLLHVRSHPYVRLLRRLLLETDVPLRVPSEELPTWLREGRVAKATLWTLDRFNAALHPILRREKIRRLLKRVLKPAVAQQAVGVMRNRNGMLNG